MKQKQYTRILLLIGLVMTFGLLSGCNRGYGCPGELGFFEILSNLF